MGFFSPNSSDNSRGNIFTRIIDTTTSLLDAFLDVFIKSPNDKSTGKEVVEVEGKTVKLNNQEIQIKPLSSTNEEGSNEPIENKNQEAEAEDTATNVNKTDPEIEGNNLPVENTDSNTNSVETKSDFYELNPLLSGKLRDDQISVKFSPDMTIKDFFRENTGEFWRPLPISIKKFTDTLIFPKIETDVALGIFIPREELHQWKNGGEGYFSILSKHENIGSLANELHSVPAISRELNEIGFEINDQNLINFAMFHELGHLACYLETDSPKEMEELKNFQDNLYNKMTISIGSALLKDNADLPQDVINNMLENVYRELPMENYSDEFAKFCMQEIFEPNGDYKPAVDLNAEIPEFNIRTTLEDYDSVFTELAYGLEYDGPDNLADIYQEGGMTAILSQALGDEPALSFDEAFNFFRFAEEFDKIQQEFSFSPDNEEIGGLEDGENPLIDIKPEDIKSWDTLGDNPEPEREQDLSVFSSEIKEE